MYTILFPINSPDFITLGSFSIRWYAIAYFISFLFIPYLMKKIYQMSEVLYDRLLLYSMFGIVIGGRLGYVLFYRFDWITEDFLQIFKIWEGGMSFHGGIIGLVFAVYVFALSSRFSSIMELMMFSWGRCLAWVSCRLQSNTIHTIYTIYMHYIGNIGSKNDKLDRGRSNNEEYEDQKRSGNNMSDKQKGNREKSVQVLEIFDALSATAPLGIFFVRIGNFINAELYGRITDVAWAVIFPNSDEMPRHPSQIYQAFGEGLWSFTLIFLLYKYTNLKNKRGFLTGCFLVNYAIIRMLLEEFRDPFYGHTVVFFEHLVSEGQILSLPMLILGLGMIFYSRNAKTKTDTVSKDNVHKCG